MRAVVVTRSGGPEVLEVRDEPEPTAGAGKLLVDVEAIGVNFRDVYEREGKLRRPAAADRRRRGLRAPSQAPGERVAWVAAPGSYAERVAVDAAKAVPVPDGVSPELGGGRAAPGHDRALPRALDLPRRAGRHRASSTRRPAASGCC